MQATVHPAREEVARLISSSRVKGTRVFNADGEHIGEVEEVMIDRVTGQVAFAVMSFGGWLGIGEKFHPLPWSALDYEPSREGYVVDLDRRALKQAPSFARSELTGEHLWRERLYLYQGSGPSGA